MRIVIVGHVDHGKSTLIGRLFHDTNSLPEGRLEALKETCERRGVPFEWAFLMDALQSERDQNITIDSAQIWFKSALRRYVIIDAPGHLEFLKNMITGAASADAAVIMVAADEGVRAQSRRHGVMLQLLGIREVVVAVNKMDLVGFDEARFRQIAADYTEFLGELGVTPRFVVPISAHGGDNVVTASAHTPWYSGPTVLAALDAFVAAEVDDELPLRIAIQDVYRFDSRRIIAGRVEAGTLRVGDTVRFYPGGEVQRVAKIESWSEDPPTEVHAGQSVGFTLDDQIFVERGQVAAIETRPPLVTRRLRASLFWMGRESLQIGREYRLKLMTADVPCTVVEVVRSLDPIDAEATAAGSTQVPRHGVAEVIIETRAPLAIDLHQDIPTTGRFVIVAEYDVVGGGIVTGDASHTSALAVAEDAGVVKHAPNHRAAELLASAMAGRSVILDHTTVSRLVDAIATAAGHAERAGAIATILASCGISAIIVSDNDI